MSATQAQFEFSTRSAANATSSTPVASATLQVVCAFPLSSNYGPGSRILYYILVAACVTFRKAEWLRNACLAAALVLPAISAFQGLVLASLHTNGAVDMDIYGAFQFCAIGILAAPLTVRLSRTYFYDPGRNIIFLWTILILVGLLALCVEFYRVTPTSCSSDDLGNPLLPSAARFPYGRATCRLNCSEEKGPFSPMRGGAAANVDVIPVPQILTFNASMLLAASFCIPAILSLIFTWDRILEINWKRRRHVEQLDARIEGANITLREMKGINNVVRKFLSVIEIPLFGGVILTIIGVGEANFFSPQVLHMTEPMASIGQWSPIAGTLLAALGSLYLLWSTGGEDTPKEDRRTRYGNSDSSHLSRSSERQASPGLPSTMQYEPGRDLASNPSGIRSESPYEIALIPTITHPGSEQDQPRDSSQDRRDRTSQDHLEEQPTAGRHVVRKWLTSAANYMGDAAHNKLDPEAHHNDEATHGFPEVPGEVLRNPDLEHISRTFSQLRRDRANSSYSASIISSLGIEGTPSPPPTHDSPRPETSPARKPKRRDTLEVPKEVHGRSESH
ncbi:hypothetical protein EJ02DRAFT_359169 [Clathrospora elynae]|uniref:Uncharacterized protein n=1 Tax=Clathrospora elynae TaxID=706981 RepID=A0A6A5S9F0_9PLEO|nr:hypothetical protein EJ02DRAFT_359169 [Clathrospora elynae]